MFSASVKFRLYYLSHSLLFEQMLKYLEANVTPYIAKCMVDIERTKPLDPLQYLIDFLEKQSEENQARARENAYSTFMSILADAEDKYGK
jgi:Dpy-30 motif